MTLPTSPFSPVPVLFLSAPDSDLMMFLGEMHRLAEGFPALVSAVEADLDAHGLAKKALRAADAAWVGAKAASLPGLATEPVVIDPARLVLSQGRPRTPAYIVLMAVVLRGYFGAGFKACDAATMMEESITLHIFFTNLGLRMPGRSTLTELVNAVSIETRVRILDAQAAQVLGLGWDDFSVMLQDSTHVEGNTAWPTDSRLLVDLAARLLRIGAALPRLDLPVMASPMVSRHVSVMTWLAREIALAPQSPQRGRTRRKLYRKLLWRAHRVYEALSAEVARVEEALARLDVLPSRRAKAERAAHRLRADVDALAQVIANCEARVIREEEVRMADKKLSVSDPDVGFIAKGQRQPVIGYKPQLARSGTGFITGLLLPRGNAADSKQLVPMVDEVVRRTGVVPDVVSVDDGYASKANVEELRGKGVKVISINGAKGRALTADADWNSDEYAHARDHRSAVESLMFTLKQGFHFGEVARRGLIQVHGELLEKAIAYNLCHMVRMRLAIEWRAAMDRAQARERAA